MKIKTAMLLVNGLCSVCNFGHVSIVGLSPWELNRRFEAKLRWLLASY
jgi:hypothetical protein